MMLPSLPLIMSLLDLSVYLLERQTLSKTVYLFMVKYEGKVFIYRVPSCFSCYRLGHVKVQCKGQHKCIHCRELSHGDETSCSRANSPPTSIKCKGAHVSTDRSCPELKLYKQIREYTATQNIPLTDAKRIIRSLNNNGILTKIKRLPEEFIVGRDFISFLVSFGNIFLGIC